VTPAPLAVTVEVRALDTAPRLVRAFRVSRAIGADRLRLARDLPFEAGRPVAVELRLPDDELPIRASGVVINVPPDDETTEGEASRPRAIELRQLDADSRRRLHAYVTERTRTP
jgi:hypothetical protein